MSMYLLKIGTKPGLRADCWAQKRSTIAPNRDTKTNCTSITNNPNPTMAPKILRTDIRPPAVQHFRVLVFDGSHSLQIDLARDRPGCLDLEWRDEKMNLKGEQDTLPSRETKTQWSNGHPSHSPDPLAPRAIRERSRQRQMPRILSRQSKVPTGQYEDIRHLRIATTSTKELVRSHPPCAGKPIHSGTATP